MNITRRSFLKGLLAGSVAAVIPPSLFKEVVGKMLPEEVHTIYEHECSNYKNAGLMFGRAMSRKVDTDLVGFMEESWY